MPLSTLWSAVSTLALSLPAVFGIRAVWEQPPYEVVARLDDATEVRRYGDRVAAEVTVAAATPDAARAEAFGLLFRYIAGANRAHAAVSMTAPVATDTGPEPVAMTTPVETASEDGATRMRFFLPARYTVDSAPVPADARIRIVPIAGETVAAVCFSGAAGDDAVRTRSHALQALLSQSEWQATGRPVTFTYDPPFTIPFLRRTEVVVAVARRRTA